mgnify:FL=1|tara:strand:+ start:46 stop:543 length:498 start_codon:yes stop_codon:yes gene_type:complete
MSFKNLSKNFYSSLIIVSLIFVLDRISKIYVIHLSNNALVSKIFSSKFLNIHLVWNEGIAFGLFSFDQNSMYNTLTAIILLVIIIIFFMITKSSGFKRISLLMILGGALGNAFDRVFTKAVPDFIDFHIGEFHWFIFNVSDIFITLGVIFMIIIEITESKKNEKN